MSRRHLVDFLFLVSHVHPTFVLPSNSISFSDSFQFTPCVKFITFGSDRIHTNVIITLELSRSLQVTRIAELPYIDVS